MISEIERGIVPINETSKEIPNVPNLTRDARRRVRWTLPGNNPEENEQLGIQNVQGLFFEKFPEFNELFPRGEDGRIAEDKREEAREFILEYMGSKKKTSQLVGSISKPTIPYLGGHYRAVLSKSFSLWGIEFDWGNLAPEKWMTNNPLAEQLGSDRQTIGKLAGQFRSIHPDWFKDYIDSAGRNYEHYSPELVELVSMEIKKRHPAPEGWVTVSALARRLKKGHATITNIVVTVHKS